MSDLVVCSKCSKSNSKYSPSCEYCGEAIVRKTNDGIAPRISFNAVSDLELMKIVFDKNPSKDSTQEEARKEWECRNLSLEDIKELKNQLSQSSFKKLSADEKSLGCPNCSELNNPSFEMCWKCSYPLKKSNKNQHVLDDSNADTQKKCPFCAEKIHVDAVKCKHCYANLLNTNRVNSGMPGAAKFFHILAMLWTLMCLIGAVSGVNSATQVAGHSDAAAVGVGCGVFIWVLIWFFPVVGLEIIAIAITVSAKKK